MFENLVKLLPPPVTNAMMVGVLFGFGLKAADGPATGPAAIALLINAVLYDASVGTVGLAFAKPEITAPAFSKGAMLSLAWPCLC